MLRWLRPAMTRVVLSCITLIFAGTQLISPVRADASSGWLSQANPKIEKVTQLTSNQSPGISNRDCTQQTVNSVNPSNGAVTSVSDCFAQSTLGSIGLYGSPLIFNGTSQAVQVNPNYPYLIQPIPNQGMMLALTSAPVRGSYMHFYQDIRQHITANYSVVGGPLLSYTVTGAPDFSLRDKATALLPTSAVNTLSYSSNGSWMVVDTYGSFVRINLATFDVVPFASSLSGVNDYADHKGVTAISDDGRYAAVASTEYGYFKVYDLDTCSGSTTNNYNKPLDCQSRDYWPSAASSINGFKAIYGLRFINDDNISMTAVYNWQSGTSYDAAKFTVTAPGKLAHSLDYLALGDSFISGEGEFQYKSGTDTSTNYCHQSPLSYPFIVGAGLYNQYNSIACSGAVLLDISSQATNYKGQVKDGVKRQDRDPTPIFANFETGKLAQWEFVKKYQPRVVTLSIGGNDIGFGKIVAKCVVATVRSQICYNSYDERMALVKLISSKFADLQNTYRQILKNDPGVQLYVVGYPQVVTQGACGLNVQLNSAEIDMAQNLIAYLDSTIERAATSVGARYVDAQYAFAGHRLCEASGASVAMNGVTAGTDRGYGGVKFLGAESYHPNILGHQLLAQAILGKTNNLKQAMPTADDNIQAPKLTDPLAQALIGNYPNSGNATAAVVNFAGEAVNGGGLAYRSVGASVSVGSAFGLKSSTSYQAALDGAPAGSSGSFTTDSAGNLNFTLIPPASTSTGYHTLSIKGTNLAGQTMEVLSIFYVAASPADLDGDGKSDAQQQCVVVPDSGVDSDKDGVDDACDPVIGEAPKVDSWAQVFLTDNTITATRP